MMLSDARGPDPGGSSGPGKGTGGPGAPRGGARVLGAFYTMITAVGLGVLIGWSIDRHYGTRPWWTLGFSFLMLIVGFYQLIRESNR